MILANLTRRRLLAGLAAASTAATIAAVPTLTAATGVPTLAENPELIRLGDILPGAVAEYHDAENAYRNIVREWGPRVPLAPDAIAYDAGAGSDRWERTIHGFAMMPDRSLYDVPQPYVHDHPRPRSVQTADYFAACLKGRQGDLVRKRPKHPLTALDVVQIEMEIGLLRDKVALAKAYEVERARVIAVSGIEPSQARLDAATDALATLIEQIIVADETTMAGVVIKAQAIEAWQEVAGWHRLLPSLKGAWGAKLASAILRIADTQAA